MINYYVIDWQARDFKVYSTWADVQAFFEAEEVSLFAMETQYMVIKGRDMDPI